MHDDETRLREFRGLKEASEATGCKNCIIITLEESDETVYEGLNISIIPAWKWALHSTPNP